MARLNATLAQHADRVSTLPPEMLLGYLLWYTIPMDFHLPYGEFLKLAEKYALDTPTTNLPARPFASDVYRRALKANEERTVPDGQGGTQTFMIRKYSDHHQIVREARSLRGKKLAYKVLANLNFDRPSETILLEALEESDPYYDAAKEIARDIRGHFVFWRNAISERACRQFVRDTLYTWSATCVRQSGGVYFLMPTFQGALGALQGFLEEASRKTEQCKVTIIPLIDDKNQRLMLEAAFESEAVADLEGMIDEINAILGESDKKISQDKAQELNERFLNQSAKTTEYGDLLDSKLGRSKAALEILQAMMPEVMMRLKV